MQSRESDLQSACVRWFRYAHQKYSKLLFAVPNGHKRNVVTAVNLKNEGVVAGVADLILLVPNRYYSTLCIEMKADIRCKQTLQQREFQDAAEAAGNRYVVCHDFDEFKYEINQYLNGA